MPTCPGCDRKVSYDQLDNHVRHCTAIWSDDHSLASIDRRLTRVEQLLENRFREKGTDFESRVVEIDTR